MPFAEGLPPKMDSPTAALDDEALLDDGLDPEELDAEELVDDELLVLPDMRACSLPE